MSYDEYRAARDALDDLLRKRDSEVDDRVRSETAWLRAKIARIKAEIEADVHSRYRAQHLTLLEAVEQSRTVWNRHLSQQAQERTERRMKSPLVGRRVRTGETMSQYREGVVEVYREGDPVQSGLRYSKPTPGDLIIREIKNDGTPSRVVHRIWGGWDQPALPYKWDLIKEK